jgi:colicin import membrane protein
MNADQARMEFAPPPTPGLVRAMALAIVAHALLLAVLSLGVQWKRDPTPVTVEAELWSALPVQAAPKTPDPIPPPPPEPAPPKVVAKEVVTPPPPIPAVPDPSIAIAKEKARQQKEKEREQERDRQEVEKRQKDAALKAKKLKDEKEAREAEQREKLARDKKQQQLELQKAQSAKTDADAKKIAELRKQQIDRMNRMANQATGSGDANASGLAKQSSGPSASYAGRIRARIKPNITYTDSVAGNPTAEVEVRTSPDGTIISRKLVKSSGVKSWDDAVLNAIDKTEVLPRDVDGRVQPMLTLVFSPKD